MNMAAVKNIFVLALWVFFLSGIISCSSISSKMDIMPIEGNTRKNNKALVFVHGVLGNHKETWTNTSSSEYWPSLLAKEVMGKYDVYVVSYDTSFDESPVIFQLGKDLNEALIAEKIFPKDVDDTTTRYKEVIFIAHSMGNLIVQTALLAGNSALELKVPLLLSIAAPWEGSNLAGKGAFLFLNPQFNDMEKLKKNSFLQLLKDVWKRRNFPIRIVCASEGKDYSWLFVSARVVNKKSATALCPTEEQKEFNDEDHLSIVKPQNAISPVHRWLSEKLTKKEKQEMPWKLPRWIGREEKGQGGERKHVCKIVIAGKEFAESNILMEMMALVIEDRIKLIKKPNCTDTEKELKHEIQVVRKYDHGNAPFVLSELKNENIDIYAEYSGALLYSYLDLDAPEPTDSKSDEEIQHEPEKINELMSSAKYPDFHKMKLLPRFGFDSRIELVMLKSTAERLQMLGDGDTTVTYTEIADNAGQLAIFGDRDLFKRRDALGGLKAKIPQLDPNYPASTSMKEVSFFHEDVYSALDASDCKEYPNSEYCNSHSGLQGVVVIGFKTDPQAIDLKYVKIDGKEQYEFPKHWASPMVHKFLDHAFPELAPTKALERLKGKISNEEMLGLVRDAKEYEQISKTNQNNCEVLQRQMTPEEREKQGKCNFQDEFRKKLKKRVMQHLIDKGVIKKLNEEFPLTKHE